ncbi:hypothetical protein EMPG_16494 [Blastomyces silverae]|uniref:Uncharacterized protein n=1 Tax=Blastomyces silverae TaxID=2060906 RepID=A0A0H1B9C5_9EURO|nr:hypothetical protein EMPG_16494 [Blastomyces silverae]
MPGNSYSAAANFQSRTADPRRRQDIELQPSQDNTSMVVIISTLVQPYGKFRRKATALWLRTLSLSK